MPCVRECQCFEMPVLGNANVRSLPMLGSAIRAHCPLFSDRRVASGKHRCRRLRGNLRLLARLAIWLRGSAGLATMLATMLAALLAIRLAIRLTAHLTRLLRSRRGGGAPVAVHSPRFQLACLGTVLGALTPPAFSELPRVLFPFAACEVRALADPALVLADEIAHDDAGPVRKLAQ